MEEPLSSYICRYVIVDIAILSHVADLLSLFLANLLVLYLPDLCTYNIGSGTGFLDAEIYYKLRRWKSCGKLYAGS